MRRCWFFLTLIIISSSAARGAHPVSITWLTADLQDDRVLMSIKLSAEDLLYFHELKSDSLYEYYQNDLIDATKQHVAILQKAFVINDENGQTISGSLISSNISSLTNESIHLMDLMKFSLVYHFEFKLDSTSEMLTFKQNLKGVPAITFFTLTKNGNTLINQQELSANKSLTIQQDAVSFGKKEGKDFMLSYFTISDTRIIHEMTLSSHILKSFLQTDEIKDAALIRDFMENNSSVEVNNQIIQPIVASLTFLDSDGVNQTSSLVNIQIAYPISSLGEQVTLTWDHFNWQMRWFESIVDAFGEQKVYKFSRFKTKVEVERESESLDEDG